MMGVKGFRHSEKTKKLLSKQKKGLFGEKSNRWKGGKIIVDGYRYIYSPNHPNKTQDGYVCEHRLVMEKRLGRYLNKDEEIHHIDGDRLNNNLNNLRLYTVTKHKSIHAQIALRDKLGRFVSDEH